MNGSSDTLAGVGTGGGGEGVTIRVCIKRNCTINLELEGTVMTHFIIIKT